MEANAAALTGPEPGPRRRCLVSGAVRPVAEMIRFVVAPDGGIVPDLGGRLPGRGLWLSARRDMVNTACAKNLFGRAARRNVTVSADLTDRLEGLLTRRCLDLLGLARRAGEATAGYEKARAWLRAGKAGLMLAAADGAPGGRTKVRALASGLPLLELFDGAELGAALGRARAVHVVVAPGTLADRLVRESSRLSGFRDVDSQPCAGNGSG